MNWLESLIYGLVSGLAEFLPISSSAHQVLLMQLFGIGSRDTVRDLTVHIAILLSLLLSCRTLFEIQRRERRINASHSRIQGNRRSYLDLRIVRTAALPMLVCMLLYPTFKEFENNLALLSLFQVINGILLFIPDRMLCGNKDARSMTGVDSILIGLSGALSVFPGLSRIAGATSTAITRGADKRHVLNWVLLLSIPALVALIVFDFLEMSGSVFALENLWGYLLSAAGAFSGGYISIALMRFLTVKIGFSGFCYYSWGAAIFSFILYLTI